MRPKPIWAATGNFYITEKSQSQEDLPSRINEIIQTRGICAGGVESQERIFFWRELHNRSTILFAVKNNQPLVHKVIGEGRSLIYRQGTPKSFFKKLIENA